MISSLSEMTTCFALVAANFINTFLLLKLFILGQRLLRNALGVCELDL